MKYRCISRHSQVIAFISTLAGALLGAGAARAQPAPARPPNIVFILADDLGIDGVSCYGGDRFRTTNIDALAGSGVRFRTCFATPLCGPSRCEIMTGRYPFRTGGLTNLSWLGGHGPNPRTGEIPIATVLKNAGYVTGHAGKWRQLDLTPHDWGFDEYATDATQLNDPWHNSYILNGKVIHTGHDVYLPDVMQSFAIDFFRRHQNQPFFFYYASHLVHIPIQRTPDTRPGTSSFAALYADNVAYLDKQVGGIVAALAGMGLSGNTLILFSGDNGTTKESLGTIGGRLPHGFKGTMTEGGSRVPLIASWPGVIPSGGVSPALIDFTDFYATFAQVAGATMPSSLTFDSRSFAPLLRNPGGSVRSWVFVQLGADWYVRDTRWKLTGRGDLLDMSDAPFTERLVPAGSGGPEAAAARANLQAVLNELNPHAGKEKLGRIGAGD